MILSERARAMVRAIGQAAIGRDGAPAGGSGGGKVMIVMTIMLATGLFWGAARRGLSAQRVF